jgi:hypothetical protein
MTEDFGCSDSARRYLARYHGLAPHPVAISEVLKGDPVLETAAGYSISRRIGIALHDAAVIEPEDADHDLGKVAGHMDMALEAPITIGAGFVVPERHPEGLLHLPHRPGEDDAAARRR